MTTEPQKPSGPPLNIQIQAISSTELVVTWAPPQSDLRNGEILGYNVGFREERFFFLHYIHKLCILTDCAI